MPFIQFKVWFLQKEQASRYWRSPTFLQFLFSPHTSTYLHYFFYIDSVVHLSQLNQLSLNKSSCL